MRYKLALTWISISFLLQSCATTKLPYTIERVDPELQYEHESIEQILAQELANTPMQFTVAIPDDRYAWERARIFFAEHTSGAREEITEQQTTLSNRDKSGDAFVYLIEKASRSDGFNYKVNCLARNPNALSQATRNAQNLARFVREGKIELGMIENNG